MDNGVEGSERRRNRVNELGAYAEIVRKVKEGYAKKGGRHTGDEIRHEIAMRWARHQRRQFDEPAPAAASSVARSTEAPTVNELQDTAGQMQTPGGLQRIKVPDDGLGDED